MWPENFGEWAGGTGNAAGAVSGVALNILLTWPQVARVVRHGLIYGVVVGGLAISARHVVLLPTAVLTAVAVTRARRGEAVD